MDPDQQHAPDAASAGWSRFRRPEPGESRPVPTAVPPRPLHPGQVPAAPGVGAASATVVGPSSVPPVVAPGAPSSRPSTWAPEGTGGHVVGAQVAAPAGGGPGGAAPYFEPWPGDEWDAPRRRAEAGPSRPLAVASIVFAVFVAPLGLVFGLVAAARARREGSSTRLAAIGIVLACVVMVVSVVWGVAWLDHVVQLAAACRRVGPGEYVTGDGSIVTCS